MTTKLAVARDAPKSVTLEGLRKVYAGSVVALDGVDLHVEPGEFVSLLGPSGCGKTTTLKVIAGLERATTGRVFVGEQDVSSIPINRRNLGVVFQNYALFPHMDVVENVEFGLRMGKVPAAERRRRTEEVLELVGLADKGEWLPRQLSGGQQQRVALARAIVIRPDVLLLDESLAALDRRLRQQMQRELKVLQRELGLTTIFVTHDQEEALSMSDRVVVIADGRIAQIGTPEEVYRTPSNEFVLSFLGAATTLRGTVTRREGGALHVDLAGDGVVQVDAGEVPAGVGDTVLVAARPEDIQLCTSSERTGPNALSATLDTSSFAGPRRRHYLDLRSGRRVLVDIAGGAIDAPLDPGEQTTVLWPRRSVVLMD